MAEFRNSKKYSIGVFDSGFGGLQILRYIVNELPQYNYIYLGDTARTPYGTRSPELVYQFTRQAVDFLFEQNCWLIILACNTASAEALRKIQQEYLPRRFPKRRVLGVIIPAAEEAAKYTKSRVGVIATEGSVASGAFVREIKKLDPRLKIFQQACPLLVPIVESGEGKNLATSIILKKYLQPLMKKRIDTLILGCTHYGVLENKIKKIIGNRVYIVDEGTVVGKKLKNYLQKHAEAEKMLGKNSKIKFYTTDLTDKFKVLGNKFFGKKITPQKVSLDER